MTCLTVSIMAVLFVGGFMGPSDAAVEFDQDVRVYSPEDYALYDQTVTSKFLTSATRLILIERMTRLRFSPDREGPGTVADFQGRGFFYGELPSDLIQTFISVNRQSSRLEGLFRFGVPYRFATGDTIEEPDVSLPHPITVRRTTPVQAPSILNRLSFSRVARSLHNDHALMYVEILRPDGTGAGFLAWFRRQGRSWTLFDTEVVWTIRNQVELEEGAALAP